MQARRIRGEFDSASRFFGQVLDRDLFRAISRTFSVSKTKKYFNGKIISRNFHLPLVHLGAKAAVRHESCTPLKGTQMGANPVYSQRLSPLATTTELRGLDRGVELLLEGVSWFKSSPVPQYSTPDRVDAIVAETNLTYRLPCRPQRQQNFTTGRP